MDAVDKNKEAYQFDDTVHSWRSASKGDTKKAESRTGENSSLLHNPTNKCSQAAIQQKCGNFHSDFRDTNNCREERYEMSNNRESQCKDLKDDFLNYDLGVLSSDSVCSANTGGCHSDIETLNQSANMYHYSITDTCPCTIEGEVKEITSDSHVGETEGQEKGMNWSSNSCSFGHNIQAIAENNYIKMKRAEHLAMTDLEEEQNCAKANSNQCNIKRVFQNEVIEVPHCPPERSSCSHMAGDDLISMKIERNKPVKTRKFEYRCAVTDSCITGRINPQNSNQNVSSFTNKCFGLNDVQGSAVNLQWSKYISMLSLPDNCGQCDLNCECSRVSSGKACVQSRKRTRFIIQSDDSLENHSPGHFSKFVEGGTQHSCINYLPSPILLQILRNLSVFARLQCASLVCKYWYNLCRDPDLWTDIDLGNQHRMKDSDLTMVRPERIDQGYPHSYNTEVIFFSAL